MAKRIHFVCFWVILIFSLNTYAQDSLETQPAIKVIARPLTNSILLRWAPTTPVTWQLANQHGYIVERYTVLKDGKLQEKPQPVKLTNQPNKPLPLDAWETLVNNDKYAPIAAQALYGETFDVQSKDKSNIISLVNASREQESRFSFALFAADLSVEVAKASGLYWEDKTVTKGEKYLYKIYAQVPVTVMKIDTGYVYTGTDEYQPLPRITQLQAEFADKSVLLSWDKTIYDNIFTAYTIERSDDGGKTFKATEDIPFLNTEPLTDKKQIRKTYRIDSLPQNHKEYFFRVKGLTPFGEISSPSDTVSGVGYVPLRGNPVLVEAVSSDNKIVNIRWDFPAEGIKEVKGFIIERASKAENKYDMLTQQPLSKETRTFVDKMPLSSNYYKIKALGNNGEYSYSYPFLVTLVDSFPPVAPVNLKGQIDSTGVVKLTWQKNKEADLYGYRVFRSNFPNAEYVQITKEAVLSELFYDTIAVNTLTSKIYYKVVAIDSHYNPSEFSAHLELKRPDLIPPVSPVFDDYKATKEGVFLSWQPSSSEDVVKHAIYRNPEGSDLWELLKVIYSKDTTSFMDKTGSPDKLYAYTILAVDEAGLESTPAKPITIKKIDDGVRAPLKVYSDVNRKEQLLSLSWTYNQSGVDRFLIYRSKANEPLRLLTSVNGNTKKFEDKNLTVNTTYKYSIKARYKDGSESPMSQEIIINY